MRRSTLGSVAMLAAAAALGASQSPRSSAYSTLDREAEPLRSTFNADVGKTRILMLVAPT